MEIGNLEVYGIIYKITNKLNNRIYIGQTARDFNKRYFYTGETKLERVYNLHKNIKEKNNGYYNRHLLESMEKYSLNNFELVEVFDIAFSKEELNIKEQCWISIYDSYHNGYNQNLGGDGNYGVERKKGKDNPNSKSVVQLSKNGEYIKMWECMVDAEKELHITTGGISGVCTGLCDKNGYIRKSIGGFIWKFLDDYNKEEPIIYENKVGEYNKKPIVQLDLNGNFINEHNSISDACKEIKDSITSKISNCCQNKRKSHNGYMWIYKEDYNKDKDYNYNVKNNGKSKSIIQLSKDRIFISEYDSMSNASKKLNLNISKISDCCNNKRKTHGNYIWLFKENYQAIIK